MGTLQLMLLLSSHCLLVKGSDARIDNDDPFSTPNPNDLFDCPPRCEDDGSECACPGGFTFKVIPSDAREGEETSFTHELFVKQNRPFDDVSQLGDLGADVGGAFTRILIKCNYTGSFADLLRALKVTNLTTLVVDTHFTDASLSQFSRLPYEIKGLKIQQKVSRLPPSGIPREGFESLQWLEISNTRITNVPNGFFRNLGSLSYLELDENDMLNGLPPGAFSGLSSLKELRLVENRMVSGLTREHLEPLAGSLEVFRLDDDGFEKLPGDLLGANSKLKELVIKSQSCEAPDRAQCTRYFNSTFFQSLVELEHFAFKAGSNEVDAKFSSDSFVHNPRLRTLRIENAELLPNSDLSIVKPLTSLQTLSVTSCYLESLSLEHLGDSVKRVTLGQGNYFFCDSCDTVNALWDLKLSGRLQEENVTITCFSKQVSLGYARAEYCSHVSTLQLVVGVLLPLCVVFVVIAVAYAYKRSTGSGGAEPLDDQTYEYDAFLSYADPDEPFAERLQVILEEENPFRCLIHSRDFDPGEVILQNIVRAVAASRLTVLVLSRDFLRSEWCDRELAAADAQGRSILVIMRSGEREVRTEDLSGHPAILEHVTARTYLKEGDEQFAEKLVGVVGRRMVLSSPSSQGAGQEPWWKRWRSKKKRPRLWREHMELEQNPPV